MFPLNSATVAGDLALFQYIISVGILDHNMIQIHFFTNLLYDSRNLNFCTLFQSSRPIKVYIYAVC